MRFILIVLLFIPSICQAYTIDEWISFYLRDCKPEYTACRENLEKGFGKMIAYSNITFKYLDKRGLPRWLATIPFVESDYREKAVSDAGAIGMWQIMPYHIERYKTRTIKRLGREITIVPNDDQIKAYGFNPIISTEIATHLLADLYAKYSDKKDMEKLAIMAYNGGNRVDLWLSGKSELRQETIDYYNKIMAIQHILTHMKRYEIEPVTFRKIFIFDYIKALVSMEKRIEREKTHELIAYILG